MEFSSMDVINGAVVALTSSAVVLYVRSMKGDLKDVVERMTKLSNGCFERHEKIAREAGQNEMKISAAHDRIDRLEEAKG